MAKQTSKKPTQKTSNKLSVETLVHDAASRTNIPTAELQPVVRVEDQKPVPVTFARHDGADGLATDKTTRNRDLDPQLVWRGKDEQDWSDLVVQAPPIYIQEKIHPKHLIDDLLINSNDHYILGSDFRTIVVLLPQQLIYDSMLD